MLTIGLVLGGEFSRYCALDADGKPVEEGTAPGTEAGFRQHFASMPPSVFAVEYRPAARGLYRALVELGHTLFFSGPVSEPMKAVVAPHALHAGGSAPAFVVSRHALRDGDPTALRFAFSIGKNGEIIDSAYFIGPVGEETDFAALPPIPPADARGSAAARSQARRLSQLVRSDESCLATVAVPAAA